MRKIYSLWSESGGHAENLAFQAYQVANRIEDAFRARPVSSPRGGCVYSALLESYSAFRYVDRCWSIPVEFGAISPPIPRTAPARRTTSVDELLRRAVERGRGPALEQARKRLGARMSDGGVPSLKEMRLRAGMSQADLADKIGSSQPKIARLEAGKETNPSLRTCRNLANALGTDMNSITSALMKSIASACL